MEENVYIYLVSKKERKMIDYFIAIIMKLSIAGRGSVCD